MRKFLISIAAAASAAAFATPAAAQYYPQQQPGYGYGYGQNYNQGYGRGYNQGYGQTGRWHSELQQIRYAMRDLGNRGRLTRAEHRDLERDIRSVERALYTLSRRGVNGYDARNMDQRISRLHYELRVYSDRDGRRRNGW